MKVKLIFIFFLSITLSVNAQNLFEGKIEYSISENLVQKPREIQYFFNQQFVKRIDTSDNYLSKAGYIEFTWDMNTNTQYFINHNKKNILVLKYNINNPHPKLLINKDVFQVNGHFCNLISKVIHNTLFLRDTDYVVTYENIYFVDSNFKINNPIESDTKYENLNLNSTYIPIKIYNTSYNSDTLLNTTTITATKIEKIKLSNTFFSLPKNYQLIPYNENIIKGDVRVVISQKIDFRKISIKVLTENGNLIQNNVQ